jgi:TDG/mug DNA glycosylase family protein
MPAVLVTRGRQRSSKLAALSSGVPEMRRARFSREDLERHQGRQLLDLVGPGMRLLWVTISPGLWSVAVGAPFAHPANRFWPALHAGRVVDRPIRVSGGMREADRRYIAGLGMGFASLVPQAVADPAALTAADLRAGRKRLVGLVEQYRPRVVAVCGILGYQLACSRRDAVTPGKQNEPLAGADVWVVPNPSVANDVNILELAAAYRAAAIAAGITEPGRRPAGR